MKSHRAELGWLRSPSWLAAERDAIQHHFAGLAGQVGKRLVRSTERYEAIEPTFGAIDISLSLRMTMKLVFEAAGVIERFVRQTAGERAVADDRDDRLVAAGIDRARSPCPARR